MDSRILFFLSVFAMAFSLVSINCNGLRSVPKLENVFTFFRLRKFDIICVQETFWDDDLVQSMVKNKWDGDIYFTNCNDSKRSAGVAILFRHGFDFKEVCCNELEKGRILEIHMEIEDKEYCLLNVYAPNDIKKRSNFFDKIDSHVTNIKVSFDEMFIVGDFNVITETKDKSGNMYPDSSRKIFNNFCKKHQLCDSWRIKHPLDIAFTWKRIIKNKVVQSRLDKIFITEENRDRISNAIIMPFVWSDHDLVYLCYNCNNVSLGPGVWKFNNELLKNTEFCETIVECIQIAKENLAEEENILNWYESLKKELKSIAIFYGRRKAKEKIKAKKLLQKRIQHEYKKAQKYDDYDLTLVKNLEDEFRVLEETDCQGEIIRAKIKDIELGEKSNKYFLNLEKARQKHKTMVCIQREDGTIVNNSEGILKECNAFYTKLFSNENCDKEIQNEFINNVDSCLLQDNIDLCNIPISLEDITCALSKMEANKSPGTDGLTPEFYRYFFGSIGPELLKVINCIVENNMLPVSMSQGMITLVPKKGDKCNLQNWRPITLLNTDYKIISKILAGRLTKVICNIISPDQTCGVPGRDIADNVMAMRDLINFISEENLDGYMIKVDQEKAFDRVNHEYLVKVLSKFGFPDYFVNWIKILYSSAKSCIKINGFLSEYFPILRGIRQGCPLSAVLYVLTAEPMRSSIVGNHNIKKYHVGDSQPLLFQHADDTTAFVKDRESVKEIFVIFDKYGKASGSKVNFNKSEIFCMGKETPFKSLQCDLNFGDLGHTKVLGLFIGTDKFECEHNNWRQRVDKCKIILNTWRTRSLTVKGKVLVINSLIISKLIYVLNLSHLPNWVIDEMKTASVNFIWSGTKPKIKYTVLISPISSGGLGLIDLERMRCALRCKIIKRFFDEDYPLNCVAKSLISYNLNKYDNLGLGIDVLRTVLNSRSVARLPLYYAEILRAWNKLIDDDIIGPINAAEVSVQPLCRNPFIVDSSGTEFKINDFDCIPRIKDIIYEYAPGFLPIDTIMELIDKSNDNNKKVCSNYNKIIQGIPTKWKALINSEAIADKHECPSVHFRNVFNEVITNITTIDVKYVNHYIRLKDSTQLVPAGLDYWRDQFGDNSLKIPFENCFGGLKENFRAELDFFIAHNILYTNEKLYKIGLSDDIRCTFCKKEIESISHIFVECSANQDLLRLVWDLCQTILSKSIDFDYFMKYILFGYSFNKDKGVLKLINFVLNLYRGSIWNCRKWVKKNENINKRQIFRNLVKKRLDIEYKNAVWNDTVTNFFNVFGIGEALVIQEKEGLLLAFI